MTDNPRTTLKSHAFEIDRLAQRFARLATRHREVASAVELKKIKAPGELLFAEWLVEVSELTLLAEELVREEVKLARAHGITWQEIADGLGMTRQSAHERYDPKARYSFPRAFGRVSRAKDIWERRKRAEASGRRREADPA